MLWNLKKNTNQHYRTVKLPPYTRVTEFTNYNHQLERPCLVYADTLCCWLAQMTALWCIHMIRHARAFVNYVVCSYDHNHTISWCYVGNDYIIMMLTESNKLAEPCIENMRHNQYIAMTEDDIDNLDHAKYYQICKKSLKRKGIWVRDNDHKTEKHRCAVQRTCNNTDLYNRCDQMLCTNWKRYDSQYDRQTNCSNKSTVPQQSYFKHTEYK